MADTVKTPVRACVFQGLNMFTEAQMKQYGDDRAREALEMAALKMEMQHTWLTNISAANLIRALAKEIK